MRGRVQGFKGSSGAMAPTVSSGHGAWIDGQEIVAAGAGSTNERQAAREIQS